MKPQSNPDRTSKRPYEKPELVHVSLRPEEAVLGACKTNKVSGPGQAKCTAPSPCSSSGS